MAWLYSTISRSESASLWGFGLSSHKHYLSHTNGFPDKLESLALRKSIEYIYDDPCFSKLRATLLWKTHNLFCPFIVCCDSFDIWLSLRMCHCKQIHVQSATHFSALENHFLAGFQFASLQYWHYHSSTAAENMWEPKKLSGLLNLDRGGWIRVEGYGLIILKGLCHLTGTGEMQGKRNFFCHKRIHKREWWHPQSRSWIQPGDARHVYRSRTGYSAATSLYPKKQQKVSLPGRSFNTLAVHSIQSTMFRECCNLICFVTSVLCLKWVAPVLSSESLSLRMEAAVHHSDQVMLTQSPLCQCHGPQARRLRTHTQKKHS